MCPVGLNTVPHAACRRCDSRILATLCLGVACAGGLVLALWARSCTWDDAAITLGYSRALAATGSIQFGRFGERVEGFSSLLWMLVAAAIAPLAASGERLLQGAQALCALLYLLNAWLVLSLARRCLGSPDHALGVAVAYSGLAGAIVSIADAMENHLFLTLHLALALVVVSVEEGRPSRARAVQVGLALLPVALLACRPEGILTSVALVTWVVTRGRHLVRGAAPPHVIATAVSLCLALELWRRWYFGAWLPNSVYAKMWPPYLEPFWTRAVSGAGANAGFLVASVGWMLPLVEPSRLRARPLLERLGAVTRERVFFVTVIALFFLYHLGTGNPRGTSNRIWLAMMPFALILAAQSLGGLPRRHGPLRLAAAGLCFVLVQAHDYEEYRSAPITVAAVKGLHEPAARLAALSAGRPLRLATPDVGAPLLFWGLKLELVDLALLNDRQGARQGWRGARKRLLGADGPDVIATHEPWSTLNRIAGDLSLLRDYTSVSVDGRFYLVHDRLLRRLLDTPGARAVAADRLPADERARIKGRVFTDFPAGQTGVPLRWRWHIELPPAP